MNVMRVIVVLLGFPLFCGHFGRFWSLGTQIHHLSFSTPKRFEGKVSNFEAKNAIKQGKDTKRTNASIFALAEGSGKRFSKSLGTENRKPSY